MTFNGWYAIKPYQVKKKHAVSKTGEVADVLKCDIIRTLLRSFLD